MRLGRQKPYAFNGYYVQRNVSCLGLHVLRVLCVPVGSTSMYLGAPDKREDVYKCVMIYQFAGLPCKFKLYCSKNFERRKKEKHNTSNNVANSNVSTKEVVVHNLTLLSCT